MFQFKKEIKEQVSQTEEKLNLHPVIHVSESLLDYQKKLSQTEVRSLDELQEIQNAFQAVLEENEQLKEKLGSFHETFETVGETSGQFAGVREDITKSVEEAQQKVGGLKESSGEVQEHFDEIQRTFEDFQASVQKIKECMGQIISIANQTNMLALNASIEAARAGEQGRGFAVVAGEVRNLASRSANAAKEIKGLIEESVSRVQQGSALVDTAAQTMHEIVTSVTRVNDIMGEIASASDEQRRGIEQVAQAVTQMDQVTQQNASLVEEAAATDQLANQADHLTGLVAVFNVKEHVEAVTEVGRSQAVPVVS